ncbi:MAG TPA: FAD-dependent oxidoreductase [Nocardioidaceae bacterium]|nr:FAD-dependent oxidoreductase [Nocardioidaceae bacterium]
MRAESVDLLVVGAGPAGLAAARTVQQSGARVVVLDREQDPGGIPRHCHHTGFGVRDLHRLYSGPAYARRSTELTTAAGAEIRTGWTVTEWAGDTSVVATSRTGRTRIDAGAVVLATGCRERPRPARLVPGTRPAGVFTTGALQQFACSGHGHVGRRAVIVGTEHIAFSALHTLTSSGTEVAAVITESPLLETYQALRIGTAGVHRVPVLTSTRLSGIEGRERVEGVILTDLATDIARRVVCDTVVFTGDWIPDHELCRAAGLRMDSQTHGPIVDGAGRTSRPGVFAAGNLIHPAEPADVAGLGGRHLAQAITAWLTNRSGFDLTAIGVGHQSPLAWVTPQLIRPHESPARDLFILRADEPAGPGHVVVRQDTLELHRQKVSRLVPNRPLTLRASWLRAVNWSGPGIEISYSSQSRAPRRRSVAAARLNL